jgi:hypothetical protein
MKQSDVLEQQLLDREKRYWDAIKDKNGSAAKRLSDESCLVVGAQGVREVSRNALAKMLDAAPYDLDDFSLDDVHFRRLSDDVVAMAYKVNEDLTVDGKKVELEAYDTSVWVRRDGEWLCVVHTETLAGDPFGRH